MNEVRQQQMEALQAVSEYIVKLVPGISTVIGELRSERKDDTDDFMQQCVDGLNWVIEVYNRTNDVVEETQVNINKENINKNLLDLGDALREKNDVKIADCFEFGVIPFLNQMSELAACFTA